VYQSTQTACSAWQGPAFRSFLSAPSLASAGEFSLDDSKRLCILILEKALKQLPEGQDTVLGIFDLRGFKQKNGDLGFAGFLVSMLMVFCCAEKLLLTSYCLC